MNNNTKTVRAILKEPCKPPEIVYISANDIPRLVNPGDKYSAVETDDYSPQIAMYYTSGPHNFDISFHKYNGNVLFVKSKIHHKCTNYALCDMTGNDIKRLCALMKWQIGGMI